MNLASILKVLRQTDGRDKTLKIIQYLSKVHILSLSPLQVKTDSAKKLQLLVSAFSMARKIIRLGHGLEPLEELIENCSHCSLGSSKQLVTIGNLNAFLSAVNEFFDDMVCLCKIGVVSKERGLWYEFYANYLWLICTMIDLRDQFEAHKKLVGKQKKDDTSTESKELKEKLFVNRISIAKLMADFLFCYYDIMEFDAAPRVQALCALIAGSIGWYKLYLKAIKK
jgi:hypothetical protein